MFQSSPIGFIATFALIAIGYVALTAWVANVSYALRVKNRKMAAALLSIPPILLLISPWMSLALRPAIFVAVLLVATLVIATGFNRGQPLFPQRETKPAITHLVLITLSAIFLIPFAWMVVCSLKENSQLAKFPPEWVPTLQVQVMYNGHHAGVIKLPVDGRLVTAVTYHVDDHGNFDAVGPVTISNGVAVADAGAVNVALAPGTFRMVRKPGLLWKNYPDALKDLPPSSNLGLVNLQNTLIIAVLSVIGTVLSSSLVAYGFARLNWPGRDWVFGILLATMMLPDAVTMMPRFLIFRALGMVDTLKPLWLPSFFASAFNVFLLRQFFMGIPKELEDAARIDGCGYLRTYWSIMMPLIKPSLAAVTIMTFLGSWKDFMNPLIYISSPEKMPLSYMLQLYNSAHSSNPEWLMAATTMVMLPVLVLFFFTQRYFIEGISLTGIGGR